MKVLVLYPYLLYPGVAHGSGRLLVPLLERLGRRAEITLVCGYRPHEGRFLDAARALVAHLHPVLRPFKVDKTPALRAAELARTVTKEILTDAPRFVTKLDRTVFHQAISQVVAERDFDLVQIELAGFAQYVKLVSGIPSVLVDHEAGSASSYTPESDPRVMNYVKRVYPAFTNVCTLSIPDAAALEALLPGRKVLVRRPGITIPGGNSKPPRGDRGRILFFGSVEHHPNRDALEWFAQDIWPRIRAKDPKATCVVAGGDLPLLLTSKLRRVGIEPLGFVDNLGRELDRAALVVAPIRTGRGVRIKSLETLAAARPLVTTTLGAQGLDLEHGATALIADDADAFSDAVVRLTRDPALATSIAAHGRTHVARHFTHDQAAEFNFDLWQKMAHAPQQVARVGAHS